MKKRGSTETLWVIISLLAALFVAGIIVQISKSYISNENMYKLRVAKELALEIDALYAVPGDAYIINTELYNFSIRIYNNKVEVYKDTNDYARASYHYSKSGTNDLDVQFTKPERLVLIKVNNELIIGENRPIIK